MAIVKKIADQEYVTTTVVETVVEKMNDYLLPVGGDELGGVKNGGNVTINEDGTMSADIPTDAHINELIIAKLAEIVPSNAEEASF